MLFWVTFTGTFIGVNNLHSRYKEQGFAVKENYRGTETRRNIEMGHKTQDSRLKNSGFLYILLCSALHLQYLRSSVSPWLDFYNFLDKNKVQTNIKSQT
jgi:hypothetical protein